MVTYNTCKFTTDFDYFWDLIDSGKNFTFARYADGEVMLMKGQSVTQGTQAFNVDKWSAPSHLTIVGQQLLETLNHTEENYYYAISSKSDNINDWTFLDTNIKQSKDKLTFVNLWINANYKKSLERYKSLNREVNLICNSKARVEHFPFKVKSITPFPDDCVKFWEENHKDFLEELTSKVTNTNNELFFISCGPVSEILIHNLYKSNPNNTYVDVGSSIDEFVHGRKTRPYMDDNTIYSKMISVF